MEIMKEVGKRRKYITEQRKLSVQLGFLGKSPHRFKEAFRKTVLKRISKILFIKN